MYLINLIKKGIKNKLVSIFSVAVICFGLAGGCGGANPPVAPFGSTLTFILGEEDINICDEYLKGEIYQVLVTNAEGSPLNDVLVNFNIGFGSENSFIIDTDGNGLPDARIFQLVDNNACFPNKCTNTPIAEWFGMGAFVDSPYPTTSNNSGLSWILLPII